MAYMKDNEVTESTFAFRVSEGDKEWLKEQIESLKKLANKNRKSGTRVINKNDLILEALKIGFEKVRANHASSKK